MTPEAAAYFRLAKVGDLFLSFEDTRKGVPQVLEHRVAKVDLGTITLDNGVILSKSTGNVFGRTPRHSITYSPATSRTLKRAETIRNKLRQACG